MGPPPRLLAVIRPHDLYAHVALLSRDVILQFQHLVIVTHGAGATTVNENGEWTGRQK
jgi:hypothetical protein